jgi:hypothetical protein
MNLVGIDFSINSPAICIQTESKTSFYAIIRGKQSKANKFASDFLNKFEYFKTSEIPILPELKYSDNQVARIKDAKTVIRTLVDHIVSNVNDVSNTIVGIEGFSYGSKGNRLAEIAGYSYLLRYVLIENGLNFQIFSPKTIKKIAGHGNYDKYQMIDAFFHDIHVPTEIQEIINSIEFRKSQKPIKHWLKPFEDMVDAYFIVQTIINSIK